MIKCKDCDELDLDFDTGIYCCARTNKFIMNIDDTPLNCPKRSDKS